MEDKWKIRVLSRHTLILLYWCHPASETAFTFPKKSEHPLQSIFPNTFVSYNTEKQKQLLFFSQLFRIKKKIIGSAKSCITVSKPLPNAPLCFGWYLKMFSCSGFAELLCEWLQSPMNVENYRNIKCITLHN